jgi:hypothetical protein
VNDPNFIRIKYLRYADDWLVGICGPRSLAEQVKEELKDFLRESLKLTLSEDKTRITHARKEQAQFLGTQLGIGREGVPRIVATTNGSGKPIKRRSTGSETVMTAPMSKLIKKLQTKGFCTRAAQPCTKRGWIHFDADQIVALYNGINQGLQNYYRFADNFNQFTQIQYILRFSLAKTLAAKYKCSVKQVFRKFGACADAVELADTRSGTEVLSDGVLQHRTRDAWRRLAVLNQKSEHLPAQLGWMPMPPVGKAALPFALHPTRAADTPSSDAAEPHYELSRLSLLFPAPPA